MSKRNKVTRVLNNEFSMSDYTDYCNIDTAWSDTITWADETGQYELAAELRAVEPQFGTFGNGLVEFEQGA